MPAELMLTIGEVATALRLSRSYTKKLIAAGTLPSVKVGRCRRVRPADLREYVNRLALDITPAADAAPDAGAGAA